MPLYLVVMPPVLCKCWVEQGTRNKEHGMAVSISIQGIMTISGFIVKNDQQLLKLGDVSNSSYIQYVRAITRLRLNNT